MHLLPQMTVMLISFLCAQWSREECKAIEISELRSFAHR